MPLELSSEDKPQRAIAEVVPKNITVENGAVASTADEMADEEIEQILHCTWDCQMEVRYWGCLSSWFTRFDKAVKILTVVGLAGSAGVFSELLKDPVLWQKVSAFTALFGTIVLFTDYPKDAYEMTLLSGEWGELQCDFEKLRHEIPYLRRREALAEFNVLRKRQTALEQKAIRQPNYRLLYKFRQSEVCNTNSTKKYPTQ